MKALILSKYGSPSDFSINEIADPTPKENEVLIKVHAASINDYDWCLMRGKPYIYRLMFGITKPKNPILGMELAGVIESVGENVTLFKVGDAVYGDLSECRFGAFAEYICVNEKALTLKPSEMSFEEAASLPHAAMLVLQGLVDTGKIQKQQKVLINGAGGGVGTLGLNIAKLYDAEVTGVDTGNKLKKMRSIGFDHVVDYKECDFAKSGQKYDLILDAKTSRSAFDCLRALSNNGTYVTVGGHLNRLIEILIVKPLLSIFSKKSLHIVALKPNKDLDYINKLYLDKKIQPIIDGPYELGEAPRLIQYFGEGHHMGKVVIKITD